MSEEYQITEDGTEVGAHYEYGYSYNQKFYPLGVIFVPLEDLHWQNDPAFIDGIMRMTEEFVREQLLPTVRPL